MDDQHVAVRPARHALADTSAEQSLEEARLSGSDNDQVDAVFVCDLDDLLRRLAADAGELDRDAAIREECLHTLAMLLPQRLVGPRGTSVAG